MPLVDDMEERGLVERRRDPQDRRNHALYLTAKAGRLMGQLSRVAVAHEEAVCAGLDPKERQQLARLASESRCQPGPGAGHPPRLPPNGPMTFTPAQTCVRTIKQRTGPAPTGSAGPGAWCYDHRRAVLLGWAVGVIAIIAVASTIGPRFENDFGGVGQSQQAQTILAQRFPTQAGDDAQVVFHSSEAIDAPDVIARVDQALAGIRPLPSVTSVSPLIRAERRAHGVRDGPVRRHHRQDPVGGRPAGDRQGRVLCGAGPAGGARRAADQRRGVAFARV